MSMSSTIPPEWSAARRLLAVRLDNLGDVLLTTPALHALKESLPGIHLTLLASPVGVQAAYLNPDIDDVIAYQSPMVDPWRDLPHDSQREQRLIAMLRQQRFDGAVIFTTFRQSPLPAAYLCYLADIPLRLAACDDGAGSLLTTRHRHTTQVIHEVERGLQLVGAIGCRASAPDLVLQVPERARVALVERLFARQVGQPTRVASRSADTSPLIVVHPGCSMPARRYPPELYAEAVDLLVARLGATVILTGSADERELVEHVHARLRPEHRDSVIALVGDLPFGELAALIERADLIITNNTGPMHLAAAVKTPVVALFALTNPPEQWHPWRVTHRLLYHEVACRLCYQRICPIDHACLREVSPQMVVQAASELLGMLKLETSLRISAPERLPAPGEGVVDLESQEFGWRMGAGWRLRNG